jgi:hypothetical protein
MAFKPAIKYARRHVDEIRRLVPAGTGYRGRSNRACPSADYTIEELNKCIRVPDPYYLSRGYNPETLVYFNVGTCLRQLPDGSNLVGWSIIPVYNHQVGRGRRLVGYAARNPKWRAGDRLPRWLSKFEKSDVLFNYFDAFLEPGPLFICEGPGDAMRFWEAGYRRAVATFGASISYHQIGGVWSLRRYEVNRFYIAADADEAGRRHAEYALREIGYSTQIIYPSGAKDFGEMTVEQIQEMGL